MDGSFRGVCTDGKGKKFFKLIVQPDSLQRKINSVDCSKGMGFERRMTRFTRSMNTNVAAIFNKTNRYVYLLS
jgi:hypothetical protein